MSNSSMQEYNKLRDYYEDVAKALDKVRSDMRYLHHEMTLHKIVSPAVVCGLKKQIIHQEENVEDLRRFFKELRYTLFGVKYE